MIIGLTGPLGAGKDEVAKLLRRRGFFIIDADRVAHELYASQTPVWRELIRAFGSKILNRGGKINRKKLGEIVFADKQKLKQLNAIMHPYLKESIMKIAENRKAVVINAAVLDEIGLVNEADQVWVVMASKQERIKRIKRSKNLTEKQIIQRMNSQMSQKQYLKLADQVILNNGTLAQLRRQVDKLLSY